MKTSIPKAKPVKFPTLNSVPKSYRGLCNLWLPRPIRDAETAARATALIDALAVFSNLNEDQLDYLDALSQFVSAYEEEVASPVIAGLDLLRSLMEDHAMTGADLSRLLGGSRLLGPMILRGERNITADHARKLGRHFKLSPGAFL